LSAAPLEIPVLRGRQGDRTVYVALPDNATMDRSFTSEVEPHDDRSQRALNPKHAAGIASYIVENRSEYLLGAITYAVDVEGEFVPVTAGSRLGVLRLPSDARLRSIDGQHRRQGIREALEVLEDVGDDHTALLIYVEDDLAKRRQMFSDMNWTARRVSASQNVAFDSRDPFSRATQRLVKVHPLLKDRVELELARVRRGSPYLFTLGGIYDASKRLMLGSAGKIRSYAGHDEEQIVDRGKRFFSLLETRRELQEARTAEEVDALRAKSILVSSTTLRVLAGAVHACVEHHRKQATAFSISDLEPALTRLDFRPSAELWQRAGFVSPGKATPNARNQEVVRATNLLTGELLGLRER
jgi:DGQHR domain-containing protein